MSARTRNPSNGRFSNFLHLAWILAMTTVTPVAAAPPTADPQSVSTDEDTPKAITLTGSDPEMDPLTYHIVDSPGQGNLSGSPPNITYSPNLNFNGADSFTFRVNDGTADSAPATVDITVNPINDPPVANPQAVSVDEDTPTPITLTASDPENDPLTWEIVALPLHGSLSGTAPNLTYTPDPGYPEPAAQGMDSFSFRVNDGEFDSNARFVDITVFEVNDPPTADPKSETTEEDVSVSIMLTGSDPEGDTLTFAIDSPPTHGTITGTPPGITYEPDTFYNGADSFTYVADDGDALSPPATVDITITPINDAPFAVDDNLTLVQGGTQTVLNGGATSLLDNDSDIENDAMVVTTTPVTFPANGSVTLFADGTFSYTHDNSLNLGDYFEYEVCDDGTPSECNVAGVNVFIDLGPDGVCTMPDTAIPDNDPATGVTSLIDIADSGDLANVSVALEIHHTYVGDLIVTLEHDGETVKVLDRPGRPDVPAGCSGNDIDAIFDDDGSETAHDFCQTNPSTPVLSGTLLPVEPFAAFQGMDALGAWHLKVTDNEGFDTGTLFRWCLIPIINPPGNTAPTANSQSLVTDEEQALAITLSGTDPQSDPLTYRIQSEPLNGSLSGSAPNVTYTPDTNYFGPDSFTFTVKDGFLTSTEATVSINVNNVNDEPLPLADRITVAKNGIATTLEGGSSTLLDNDTDPEGNALSVNTTPVTAPAHGSLTLNGNGTFSYDHNDSLTPTDFFIYRVCDNGTPTECADARVDIWIDLSSSPQCSAPQIAIPDPDSSQLGVSDVLNLIGPGGLSDLNVLVDIEHEQVADLLVELHSPDGKSVTLLDRPGTSDPLLVTGCEGENVVATFDDAAGGTAESTCHPQPPAISGTVKPFDLLSNMNGSGQAGDWSLQAIDASPFLTGTFRQWCLFVSLAANTPPTADPQTVNATEDMSIGVTLTGSDVDGDSITFDLVSQPDFGTLSGTAPNLTYTPNADFFGTDSFTFRTNDGLVNSTNATVTIEVANVNDPPNAIGQSVSGDEDTPIPMTLSGTDADGDSLTFSITQQPANGSLSGSGPNRTYSPDPNFNGPDSFTFLVNDGTVNSSAATVNITVFPVNDPPDALDGQWNVDEDDSVAITLFGFDRETDPLVYSIVTQPANGSLSGTPPFVTYTPDTNFAGNDSFTFKVNDGLADSTPGTISVSVAPINDAPNTGADSLTVFKGMSTTMLDGGALTLLDNDSDVEGDNMTVSATPVLAPEHGTVFLNGDGSFSYAHDNSFSATDSFLYEVCDDGTPAQCSVAEVSVYVVLDDSEFCATPLLDIPDNDIVTGISDTITLSNMAGVQDLNVFLHLTHDFVGQLSATISHDGTLVQLLDRPGAPALGASGCPSPDVEATFDDEAVLPAEDECAFESPAIAGPVTPVQVLSAFDASSVSGDWVITVTDAEAGTVGLLEQWCVIPVAATNTAPTANPQSVVTDEDVAKAITLTGNDVDGDNLTFLIETPPTQGALTGNPPNVIYTPNLNFNGTDSFTFRANDGSLNSTAETVDITINPVNDPPTADDQSVSATEDTPEPITLTGNDVEGDPLTFAVQSGPANGSLSGTPPNVTYTPDLDFSGPDSFTFVSNDGTADSGTATVSITVNPANDPPVANPQSVSTNEDTALPIVLTGSDIDGDSLTFMVLTQPSNGALSGTPPNVDYTPNANFNGGDSFTFKASDTSSDSNPATVTITVDPVNDPPVANSQSVSALEDTPKPITLTGSDIDGDPLTFAVATSPANGTLTGTPPNLTYTPDPDYTGPDSFTFTANDGTVDSTAALVTITVNPANDPPTANSDLVVTDEDIAKPVTLTGSDPDGDPLTFSIATNPSNGTLSGTPPSVTYTPDADFNGADSFTFVANDGTIDSSPAAVDITVNPINDPPVANPQSVSTPEDTPTGITLTASDVEGNPLTYSIGTGPAHGGLTGTPPNLTYTPDADYNGPDSFTFRANDGGADSNFATVSITVSADNDPPVADPQSLNTDEDTALPITLTGSDLDGDPLSFAIVTQPSSGVLSGTPPNITYTPNLNFSGADSFTFKANDGTEDSPAATVGITVNQVNDAPVANSQSVSTPEDTARAITLSGSDVDGDPLTFSVDTGPANGSLSGTAPNLTYTPDADYNGPDSFTFVTNDGTVDSTPATVTITVGAVNDPPTANAQSVNTDEDIALPITLTGSDLDGDPLSFAIVTQPSSGVLSGTPPNITYTPNLNFSGADSFTFKANDGTEDSPAATVGITVNQVNDAPVANSQSVSTPEDTARAITLSGSDVDGDPLTFSVDTGPANGSLSGTAPNLTYTPDADYNGPDSFTFVTNDGTVDSTPATVTLTVSAANDPPAANAQAISTPEDTARALTLSGSDPDGDPLSFAIESNPSNGNLSGTPPNVTYTPNANFNGGDSFTFSANDGTLDSTPATVTITVDPVNDPPVADPQSVSTPEDTPQAMTLTGSDVDGDALSFAIATGPANGSLSGSAPNVTYTPDLDYTGPDRFTFTANDGAVDSAAATVNITVGAVNDPPTANAQSVGTDEDTPLPITLTGSDPDGDPLTFTVLTQPADGVLSGSPPNVTYTPNTNFNGADSFTFKANDGTEDSSAATVSITVNPINDPPVANPQSVSTPEDTPTGITLTASDVEGNPLTYSIGTGPTHGGLTGTPPNLTYTPDADYNGPDSFTFGANDGQADSDQATVTIEVDAVNDPPKAEDQNVVTDEDQELPISLTAGDAEGDALTYSIVTPPASGALSGTPPGVFYQPSLNFNGADSFTFKANDGTEDSAPATIAITVNPINDPPAATPQSVSTPENTPRAITLSGSDVDGDPLTFSVNTGPANGSLSGTAPNLTYTPDTDYDGPDSFTFVTNDGTVDSAPATVSITVSAGNNAPEATSQSVDTDEDTPLPITLAGTDPDGDSLTFEITSPPSHGALSGTPPSVTYTPDLDYFGTDSFQFIANDGLEDSVPAIVSITVNPINDAPVAVNESIDVDKGETATTLVGGGSSVLDNDSDIEGHTLTVNTTPVDPPNRGSLLLNADGSFSYTHDDSDNFADSFQYEVCDSGTPSECDVGTVMITVDPGDSDTISKDGFETP
ncbi:Ig-like domain-containing protein [Elongatibacter sediminis]|uniref:Ig-like domain-containing protein n=1 Tax=Elongatibacter sediminis TaxID=3119006 RepID=A0AAW9RBT2_9GAMM